MTWDVEFEDEFETEFDGFTDPVKTELLARANVKPFCCAAGTRRARIRNGFTRI